MEAMTRTNTSESSPHSQTARRAISGFSLLEVLISLVVLSVGLLGMASLMSTTLKSNDSAYMRTQATVEAYNIIDRMRANSSGVTAGVYTIAMPAAAATSAPDTCTGVAVSCSNVQLASYDIGQWESDLGSRLPDGRGSITTTPIANGTGTDVVVRVLWNDSRASRALNGAPSATTLSLSVHSVL